MSPNIFSTALLLAGVVTSSSLLYPRAGAELNPVLKSDFADPAVIGIGNGAWLSFATGSNGKNVQVAKSTSGLNGPWDLLDHDLLPKVGSWSTGSWVWAPDVRRIGSKFVLYYSAEAKADHSKHCIGSAVADDVMGPYTPDSEPIACPLKQGGAIDPAGFTDSDGKQYVVYKIDGNAVGSGGLCGNGNPGAVPTPLMLQEMKADGTTKVGEPKQILDRGKYDGPLVEAPHLIHVGDLYILFFSSSCWSAPTYDISYATSKNIAGPYAKAKEPLAVTDKPFHVTAPGGAQATDDGKSLVFHADCQIGDGKKRCLFTRDLQIKGDIVSFV